MLSVRYIMQQTTVLDLINFFIKLKIISQFSVFFVEPFKASSMTGFIDKPVFIDTFRKDKFFLTKA